MRHSASQRGTPGLVAAVTYEGLCAFEFGIAVEIFGLPRPEFDFPWYPFVTVRGERKRVAGTAGVIIEATHPLATLDEADTIVMPGWRGIDAAPPARLLDALVRAHARGARLVTICSGAFVLAAAGLLSGRRATTHWRYGEALTARYPDVQFVDNVLYVEDGNIITSAGSAAGIDACVHLVRRDFGARVANQVSRRLVMPPHRDGGQLQYVAAQQSDPREHQISAVMGWARQHLSSPLNIGQLANRAAMSERTFLRKFRVAAGVSPTAWLQRERMFVAQELLETSDVPLPRIAEQCGYQSYEAFRTTFKRHVGTAPGTYRSRFRQSA